MSNESNYEDNMKKIYKQMEGMNKYFSTPEWKKAAENYQNVVSQLGSTITTIAQSEAVRSLGILAEQLHDYIIGIPKFQISEETKENIVKLHYLRFLEKIQWPLFLLDDNVLRVSLEKYNIANEEECNVEEINKIIFKHLDNEYIDRLTNTWEHSSVIDKMRLPILREAVELYKEERFWGSISILVCQLEGIISKIYQMQIDSGMQFTPDNIKTAYEHYNKGKTFPNNVRIESEKNQLLWMVSETKRGILYWIAVVDYIYKIILTSDDKMNQSNHPCRNKICHGIQLNYGTKEHALKAILTIDMLLELAEEMKRVIEINREDE